MMANSHVNAAPAGKAMLRPAWTPATIGLMVLGFIVFWPLGLAMLAYIIWGDRLDGFKQDVNRATDGFVSTFRGKTMGARDETGNVAFDDWRDAELKRLDEERMRLESLRSEFEDYARELRRAKDKKEFDRFMSERHHASRTVDGTDVGGTNSAPKTF
jgi:hypothetical protein